MLDLLNFSGRRRLPMILQTEAAECGLACLAMVSCFHGHGVDLQTLRHKHSVSLKGTTLTHLIAISGFHTHSPGFSFSACLASCSAADLGAPCASAADGGSAPTSAADRRMRANLLIEAPESLVPAQSIRRGAAE